MKFEDFSKQPRGLYHFDTWLYKEQVPTSLSPLPLEIYTEIDKEPSAEMIGIANDLASFASSHGEVLLDIIYAHYRRFELKGWLSFLGVPSKLSRSEVLSQVDSITLNVHSDLYASIHVDPKWDPEHKLAITFDGQFTEVNDAPFKIIDGVLS